MTSRSVYFKCSTYTRYFAKIFV